MAFLDGALKQSSLLNQGDKLLDGTDAETGQMDGTISRIFSSGFTQVKDQSTAWYIADCMTVC